MTSGSKALSLFCNQPSPPSAVGREDTAHNFFMILNLFDHMKLPFRKNKEFLTALYDILGFYPHDIEIYRLAFSHKSLSYRRDGAFKSQKDRRNRHRRGEKTSKPLNNERLEYLGDAVLETVISDILFRHFETKREGFLTSTRSKIVQREALNHLAEEMGLERLIQAAQGTKMVHTNIGGNAFEALMGAIYLDRGFKFCHWFIKNRVIGPYVNLENVAEKEVNFKSKLLEWSQKNRIDTHFRDAANGEGKGFRTTIFCEGITIGKGTGRSKKESQQYAAKDALLRMRREPKLYDSIFRSKEKRTAMEADESFALPKIDEIEDALHKTGKKESSQMPVLESRAKGEKNTYAAEPFIQSSDAAYDAAYDEKAEFEVIDDPEHESEYSDYTEEILPDAEDDSMVASDETKVAPPAPRPKRTRNRGKGSKISAEETSKPAKETAKPAEETKGKGKANELKPAKETTRLEKESAKPAEETKAKSKTNELKQAKETAKPAEETKTKGKTSKSKQAKETTKLEKETSKSAMETSTPENAQTQAKGTDHQSVSNDEASPDAEAPKRPARKRSRTSKRKETVQPVQNDILVVQSPEPAIAPSPTNASQSGMLEEPVQLSEANKPASVPSDEVLKKPILRHISIDEFVFGATDGTDKEIHEQPQELQTPAPKKPRRTRKAKAQAEPATETPATDDKPAEVEPKKTRRTRKAKTQDEPATEAPSKKSAAKPRNKKAAVETTPASTESEPVSLTESEPAKPTEETTAEKPKPKSRRHQTSSKAKQEGEAKKPEAPNTETSETQS